MTLIGGGVVDEPHPLPPAGPDPLWSHPLVGRLTRLGRRLRRADRARPWALDAIVAGLVFVLFGVADLVHAGDAPPELAAAFTPAPVPVVLGLQAGLVLPLLWRRRTPSVAFGVIAAVFLLEWSLGVWLRAGVALLVALYSLTLHGRLRHLPWACAVTAGALVLVAVRVAAVVSVGDVLFFLCSSATAAVALGLAVRVRRAQLDVLRDRAARLEIERDQRTRLAAATERARVAREMHDIVGHNLSVMITLADGGAYAADHTPERGKEALQLIGETGRQALGELRRMIGALRDHSLAPELSPQPGIADVDGLCARVRAAGPEVRYRTTGAVDSLDRGVQLTVYRIAQEALTNAIKHAGPSTRIDLAVAVEATAVHIRVQDSGPPDAAGRPRPVPGEGHGLAGMTERAALYGGTVSAGPRPGPGWTVHAVLDLAPAPGLDGVAP
ncbi:sensor histidine kinase [Streptomyces sp. NPDC002574]|uniref:sensor histidine kinase n=1 Tax=Streptomyces sp. NPDC002574 TaxID=3364652 RepID=UPI00367788DC